MRAQTLSGLFLSILFLVVLGCGGGGGSAVSGPAPGSAVLSGSATKGPISGGTVRVFEVISSSTSNPRANIPRISDNVLAQGTTGADGSYNITLPPGGTKGGLLVQITGGSYQDEATGAVRSLDDQFGANGMRAIFGNISGAARRTGQLSGYVTPYTEMAVQSRSGLTDQALDDANRKVATGFGLPDIIKTKPLDPNKPFPSGASADEKKYALALAGLSQYQKDFGGGKKVSEIQTELEAELSGGALSSQTQSRLQSSSNNYAAGGNNPNPGLLTPEDNSNAPVEIQVDPASASVAIGGQAVILAQVKKSGSLPVPDGTLVNFTSSFGTLSAASVATVNGLASVTLTSAAVGSATVSVKAGNATGSAAIGFFDPNAPVSLTLTANAQQGITTGSPVVLSANVLRSAGGPVPDGTAVTFSVTSGSGTLSGATGTVNGIATVNLASAAAGTVSVSASAGTASGSISVPFIVQPTQAIVKVRSTGTLPGGTLIGGIGATVTYSTGKGLGILPGAVSVSGGATGSSLIPNANTAGQVVLGLINVDGIPAGEFATLRFTIAAGNFPTDADFGISSTNQSVLDTGTQSIPGMGVGILSVTIQ